MGYYLYFCSPKIKNAQWKIFTATQDFPFTVTVIGLDKHIFAGISDLAVIFLISIQKINITIGYFVT